ncbi:hypothetical protein OSTOST_08233, partial [Ostertagia ostertagi]
MFCPICGEVVFDHVTLARHCASLHSSDGAGGDPQDYTLFKKSFESYTDFERWLSEQCERTCSSFFRKSASGEGRTLIHLRCSRAGRYISCGSKRVLPTKKQTRNCSCFLNVRINNCGRISVLGCFGHVGHKVDVALIRLTQPQEMFLKGLLEVYPVNYIIMRLKRDYPAKTSRLYHVSRSDLRSIMKKYHLEPIPRINMAKLATEMNEHNPPTKHIMGGQDSNNNKCWRVRNTTTGIWHDGRDEVNGRFDNNISRKFTHPVMQPLSHFPSTLPLGGDRE